MFVVEKMTNSTCSVYYVFSYMKYVLTSLSCLSSMSSMPSLASLLFFSLLSLLRQVRGHHRDGLVHGNGAAPLHRQLRQYALSHRVHQAVAPRPGITVVGEQERSGGARSNGRHIRGAFERLRGGPAHGSEGKFRNNEAIFPAPASIRDFDAPTRSLTDALRMRGQKRPVKREPDR